MPTVKEVIEHLQQYRNLNEHLAAHIWSEEDVLERAKENKIKITRKQAQEIIERIDRNLDSTQGITWDTLDCYINEVNDE